MTRQRRPTTGGRPLRRPVVPMAAAAAAVALVGCGGSDATGAATPASTSGSSSSAPTTSGGPGPSGDLTVFAAASLTDAFTALGEDFMEGHDVVVAFNFGASSALSQQIASGAPADVFAAASPATMQVVVDAGDSAADPRVFAANTLQIAVPPGNPAGIARLSDFADADLTIALCAPEVPCGAAAEQVFAAAGVVPAPDTLAPDVRAALSQVELGEVDASLVYRTDVIAAGDAVEGIAFPGAADAVTDYPITVLTQAPNDAAARAFVDHVLGPDGQRVLADAGFQSP